MEDVKANVMVFIDLCGIDSNDCIKKKQGGTQITEIWTQMHSVITCNFMGRMGIPKAPGKEPVVLLTCPGVLLLEYRGWIFFTSISLLTQGSGISRSPAYRVVMRTQESITDHCWALFPPLCLALCPVQALILEMTTNPIIYNKSVHCWKLIWNGRNWSLIRWSKRLSNAKFLCKFT